MGQSKAVELIVDPSESSEPRRFVLGDDRHIGLDELGRAPSTLDGCFNAPDVGSGTRVRSGENEIRYRGCLGRLERLGVCGVDPLRVGSADAVGGEGPFVPDFDPHDRE